MRIFSQLFNLGLHRIFSSLFFTFLNTYGTVTVIKKAILIESKSNGNRMKILIIESKNL